MTSDDHLVAESAVERVRQTHRDPQLRRVMAVLSLLVLLGVAGTIASVTSARTAQDASVEDVRRNADLVEQVRRLQEASNEDVHEHRVRNEQLHADLCRIVFDVATTAGIAVRPCAPSLPDGREPQQATPTPSR